MELNFDPEDKETVSNVNFVSVDNLPFDAWCPFYANCEGRHILGGGSDNYKVVELDNNWVSLPSCNLDRFWADCFYIKNNLFVAGGIGSGSIDTIERIEIKVDDNGGRWEVLANKLPYPVIGHTTSVLSNDQVYLIGGYKKDSEYTNQVWKGKIGEDKEITFSELPSMVNKRSRHFSFAIKEKLYIFGGEEDRNKKSQVEIWDGVSFKQGPEFPFYLDRYSNGDNAVLNRNGIIIVLTQQKGILTYNPLSGKINHFEEFKVKDNDRYGYAALLL